MALFFGKEFGGVVAIFVFVDDDVFRCRNEAMLNAAVPSEALLVCAGMEEADVEWLVLLQFGEDCRRCSNLRCRT